MHGIVGSRRLLHVDVAMPQEFQGIHEPLVGLQVQRVYGSPVNAVGHSVPAIALHAWVVHVRVSRGENEVGRESAITSVHAKCRALNKASAESCNAV